MGVNAIISMKAVSLFARWLAKALLAQPVVCLRCAGESMPFLQFAQWREP